MSRRVMVVSLLLAALAAVVVLGVTEVLGENNVARLALGIMGLIAWEIRRPPPPPSAGSGSKSAAASAAVALLTGELGASLVGAEPAGF